MSNHISLIADLEAGKNCSIEAAAAIKDLESQLAAETNLKNLYHGELDQTAEQRNSLSKQLAERDAAHAEEVKRLNEEIAQLRHIIDEEAKDSGRVILELSAANAAIAMKDEALKAVEWAHCEYDRSGDSANYCPSCGGAQLKSNYDAAGHKDGCVLFKALSNSPESLAAWESEKPESLRKQVAMLRNRLDESDSYIRSTDNGSFSALPVIHANKEALSNTQATAEAYMAEHDVKVLENLLDAGLRSPEDVRFIKCEIAELRAAAKKGE